MMRTRTVGSSTLNTLNMAGKVLKAATALTVHTSVTGAALGTGLMMGVYDGARSGSLRVATASFSKHFKDVFSADDKGLLGGDPKRNLFDKFMKNNTLDIPLVGPDTLPKNLITAVVNTQQARVTANISFFLNNFFKDRGNISGTEVELKIKELLLTEEGRLAMEGQLLTEAPTPEDERWDKTHDLGERRQSHQERMDSIRAAQAKRDYVSMNQNAAQDRLARENKEREERIERERDRQERAEQQRQERDFRQQQSREDLKNRREDAATDRRYQDYRDDKRQRDAMDMEDVRNRNQFHRDTELHNLRQKAEEHKLRGEGFYKVEIEGNEPTFIDTRQSFAGKAAWEGDYSYVTIEFINENGYRTSYHLPIRVNYLPIPANEIIQMIVQGVAISGKVRRFRALLKGHLSLSEYLYKTDYITFLSTLTKVAGTSWNMHVRKSKVGASLLLNNDMVDFMREFYGYDIYGGAKVHKSGFQRSLKDTFHNIGIFDMFIVNEATDELNISYSANNGIYFKTFPLSQVYTNSRKALENTVISIQKG